jgi:ketosteroid isomerase-like protein
VSQENVEMFMRALGKFREGDLQALLAHFDEEVEIEQAAEVPGVPGRQHGHAGVLNSYALWPAQWDDFRVEVLRVREIDDHVVVTVMNRGRGKESGIPVEMQFSHVYSFLSGKVIRWRIFLHEEQALKAVGNRPRSEPWPPAGHAARLGCVRPSAASG